MNTWKNVVAAVATALGVVAMGPVVVQAQGFAAKPIRIVVPFAGGSGSDTDARFYGDLLGKRLGQAVIVENRPGGSGLIAVQAVKSAPADGHSILLASNSPMAVNPAIMRSLSYDPFKDFKPLTGSTVGPATFAVKGDSPHKTIQDVVAAAKREKRPIAIGNYSAGYQLVAAWLGTAGGVEINHINYKGGSQMITDVLGGQLEMAVVDSSGFLDMHNSGRLRILSTSGAQRLESLPNVPTMIESGYADFETYVWASFFVHSATPDDVTKKLIDAFKAAMSQPEAEAYRKQRGATFLNLQGDDMRRFQVREYERFKVVAERAGLVQP